jgi:hypothetical protein
MPPRAPRPIWRPNSPLFAIEIIGFLPIHWVLPITKSIILQMMTLYRGCPIYPAMLLRPAYLSQNLNRPLPTKDGGTLRTIGEACDYMTSTGNKRELRYHWQRVCKLILAKEDVMTVSRALELALFMDAKLDVSKAPAKW